MRAAQPLRQALTCGGFLVLLLGSATAPRAQVAAPSLVPFTFFTENPAAMQWGAPSRIGVQAFQFQQVTDPVTVNDDFLGIGAGARGVWQHFSFAVEGAHWESINKPFGTTDVSDYGAAGAALGLGNTLAIGIGQQTSENRQSGFDSVNLVQTDLRTTVDTSLAGVSLRFREWLFVGGAAGKEYLHQTDQVTPANDISLSRDVYKYGIGIRTVGAVLTHLEYYVIDRSDFSDPAFGKFGHEMDRTGVIEFNFSGLLLAYSKTHSDLDSKFGSGAQASDSDFVAIGYAPYTGFTVVAQAGIQRDKFPANTLLFPPSVFLKTQTTTTYALDFTYLLGD